ncbi:MAG TPA: redoxin family protein, partial [Gammaproteobacteria bacterium]|nr:redoxin family protein [Gammaproteobacteria bacterium]
MKKTIAILALLTSFTNSVFADKPDAGDLAPDFIISQLDGINFKLSDYKGKKSVYLVFWNTWCGYCLKKVPKLKQTQKTLSDDIVIIAVNTTKEDSIEE